MFPSFLNLMMLTLEAQQVIWLRTMRLALGGARAETEAALMVSEKLAANGAAAVQMMTGASGDAVVRGYRKKVRANIRRLSKR